MTDAQSEYTHLHAISKEARTLGGIAAVLDWDQETYMPSDGASIRAEQFKVLAGIIHQKRTGTQFSNALSKLIDLKSGKIKKASLNDAQKAAVREWRRSYLLDKALPKKFVEEFAKLSSQSMGVWKHARQEDAFQQFAPYLERIVKMTRKKADLLGYTNHPYDALLNLYEPDATTQEVSLHFSTLRKSLIPLLKKIQSNKSPDDRFLFGKFAEDQQLKYGHFILKAMHYDLSKGRLDVSAHPFSSASHPHDSRITTRIHPTSLMSNIFAVIHEAGHALYEMGLPVEQYGTPLGESRSLGIHESQSRFWETIIGHSKPFWSFFLPHLKSHFSGQFDTVSLDAFYKAINKVEPSFIRIEADEVTYPLHVILRFEIEKSLIEGSLQVRELPEAWNAKMQELLKITPKTNQEGCLQDIHWSMGAFGYFPTYVLGTMYAAHLFTGFMQSHPNWEKRVSQGELGFIKEWLNQAIYQHGRRYETNQLLELATKKSFTADSYIDYLNKKYKNL